MGVFASILCAIRCAVTPLLLVFLPTLGKIWSHPASHWGVDLFVLPLAVVMMPGLSPPPSPVDCRDRFRRAYILPGTRVLKPVAPSTRIALGWRGCNDMVKGTFLF